MAERLSVVMLLKQFPATQGGAEQQVAALAPLLADRGIDLTILSRFRDDGLHFDEAEVRHIAVPSNKVLGALAFVAGAVRQVRHLRPDVLHAHSLLSPGTAAVVSGRITRTPAVAKVLLGGEGGEVHRLLAWKRGGRVRIRALRAMLDKFIVISEEIDRELAASGVPAEQRVRIPNGVDTDRFAPATEAERREWRTELGLGDGPVVLYVGRLNPQKGVGVLLDAWKVVRAARPDATLLVVGDGHERPALERRSHDGVSFVGQVVDVTRYLSASDVFVLPSFAEGLSNALLEAASAGLAIVATDVGANADVVGEAGRIVPAGDTTALARELCELLDDETLRRDLGRRARAAVERDYSLAATADDLVSLYRSLAH